jgi:hypothetical protein
MSPEADQQPVPLSLSESVKAATPNDYRLLGP